MTTLNPIELALSERVRALEKLNSQLAAEIDRQRPVVEAAIFWSRDNYREIDMRIIAENKLRDMVDAYEASAPK